MIQRKRVAARRAANPNTNGEINHVEVSINTINIKNLCILE